MAELRFVWDERKSVGNARKHGVTFAEAETVFLDEEALLIRARSSKDYKNFDPLPVAFIGKRGV